MAPLYFPKVDSNKLRFNVKNEMASIFAKFYVYLINISYIHTYIYFISDKVHSTL